MLRHFMLSLALLQASVVFSDEPGLPKSTSTEEMARLTERIEQLEKQIRELEQRISRLQVALSFQQPHNTMPNQGYLTYPIPPNTYYQSVPGPSGFVAPSVPGPSPYYPQTSPTPPLPPPYPQNKNLPDTWKSFNINGTEYFLIPGPELERMNRPQGYDKKK